MRLVKDVQGNTAYYEEVLGNILKDIPFIRSPTEMGIL